jgi:hypothetical protein
MIIQLKLTPLGGGPFASLAERVKIGIADVFFAKDFNLKRIGDNFIMYKPS